MGKSFGGTHRKLQNEKQQKKISILIRHVDGERWRALADFRWKKKLAIEKEKWKN